jgi:hypothetical protein
MNSKDLAVIANILREQHVANIDDIVAEIAKECCKKPINPIFPVEVEYYTPPWIIRLVKQLYNGFIDLDLASCDTAQQIVQAKKYYTKAQNGYLQPWFGNIFLNPPYGRDSELEYGNNKSTPVVKYWLEKAIYQYRLGHIDSICILVNRTGAQWYRQMLDQFSSRCELTKRVAFLGTDLQPKKAPSYYNDILYLGKEAKIFSQMFAPYGVSL